MRNRERVNLKVADEGPMMADMIATVIRQYSESGHLISRSELQRRFIEQQQPTPVNRDGDFSSALAKALQGHDDLHELSAGDGAICYFSSQNMTRTYALMLLQRQGDPARLIAEVVRENSATYPRPVPFYIFARLPFDLTPEEVLDCLKRMGAEEEYRDIVSTTTSASTIYLYSTLHLEPDHASMLAEWFDVGQFENP